MTAKIKTANRWLLQNLFWLVPAQFLMLIAGFVHASYQRSENDRVIIHNTEDIQQRIEADTTLLPRVDSLKETLKKLK